MTQRHRWMHHDSYNSTCVKCGTKALKRPHPYARYWFTEWHLPDGSYTNNYNGEPTPPCPPMPATGEPAIGGQPVAAVRDGGQCGIRGAAYLVRSTYSGGVR
jgi:hypothetical protein